MTRDGRIATRGAVGGIAVGMAAGWNIAAIGAVAARLSDAYGIGLATVGLFTTVQFAMHTGMQIPGGRAADRWGARRSSAVGLALIALGNAVSLPSPTPALAFLGRSIVGLGTGFALVGGSDYIRALGGSGLLQGVYGGSTILAPGIALLAVPAVATLTGFRAPFLSAIGVTAAAATALALAPAARRAVEHAGERFNLSLLRDRDLQRLGAIHAASFGLSVVVGNWVVTLLERHGQPKNAAALAGSLTLVLGFASRIAGGALLHRPHQRRWVAGSILAGAAAAIILALPAPLAVLVAAAATLGLAAGVPFAAAFTGAARARPQAPGTAVGFVNGVAALTILVATPLVGLTFSLPGDGRAGFAVLGILAAVAALATPRPAR